MSNPLLNLTTLPPFKKIEPSHMVPAIETIINDSRKAINELTDAQDKDSITWESFVKPLEDINDRLDRAWSPISHLNAVANSDEIREAYNRCLPLLSDYGTEMGQHQGLYQAVKALNDRAEELNLDKVQRKILKDDLRDFKLSGVALDAEKQKRYGEIQKRLSELTSKFEQNLLDATMAWHKDFDSADALDGLPESAIAAAKQTAEASDVDGYRITLDFPSYLPVMMHANDRELRKEVYTAFSTRASDQGPQAGQFDNSELMPEILTLRHELAKLLAYPHYGELSLATKMAKSTDEVLAFLTDLAEKSKPQAENDLKELTQYAKDKHGISELKAWDLAYYSEKLKNEKYNISQEELRPWFPENQVIKGMFEITGTLFDIKFQERDDVDTWHPDVRFFDIYSKDDEYIASFYLDLYARRHKRGGAWMADSVGRRETSAGIQKPVAFLTCNFNGPVGNKPALFTHDEVTTLFHEFGHGLHHMLTQINYASVAGISGVPWDAVELPSQFLENFCWEEEGLAKIAKHYETGEPLPTEKLERLLAAKNFQSAMQMMRQLEFSIFDFRIHSEFDPENPDQIQSTLDNVRQQVAVIHPPEFNRFQHSFGHIFAGGYAAGYYSYKWAEVLSADAFSRFEEEGIFNPQTGNDFLVNILQKGGSEEPDELFKAFRGREPSTEALLRHSGIGK
ncbi:oligopeptidase A [Kangiella sediminilitoris]|uniref:oligopeptidase A n=1 Tax=Kangiella sediminilitoris TaxID=1144748 RepID=A0A1B3BDW2_9GAMM|nr:oligopeptidase A [Kangiella sediminilitoris]AOE50953.1 Oligopeptidase A [Kangiella sediminilitoris]